MNRFMNKKVAAIGLATGLALGAAGAAFAYFTSTGSGSGTGSTGIASNWSVPNADVLVSGGALSPGQGSDTISAFVQNVGTGNQGLNALTVTIDAPTPNATYASSGPNACTAADYTLNGSGGWVISNGGDTATYTNSSAVDIAAGHYVVNDADGGASSGNALPSGLTMTMNDPASNQNQCQDATVNVSVAAS